MYASTSINELLMNVARELRENISKFELTGSGFVVRNLVSLTANVWQLTPLRGSTYHPLPEWVTATKGVLNIHNKDTRCFPYAVLAALHHTTIKRNRGHVSHYKKLLKKPEIANMLSGLPEIVSLKDIDIFVKNNPGYLCRRLRSI